LITLRIHHRTIYRYSQLVGFGPHRLMLRPRESRDLRLISSKVTVAPSAVVTWAQDVFGNAVAIANFQTHVRQSLDRRRRGTRTRGRRLAGLRHCRRRDFLPFQYSNDEWTDLGALTIQQYPDPAGRLRDWAGAFVSGNPTDTLALLKDLSAGVSAWISYQSRDDEGTQSPTETLERGWGSCRISRSFSLKRRAGSDSGRG